MNGVRELALSLDTDKILYHQYLLPGTNWTVGSPVYSRRGGIRDRGVSQVQLDYPVPCSECYLNTNGARYKRPGYLLLDSKLGPPARTMAWQKNSRIESLQIFDCTFHLFLLTCSKMKASNDGMKRDGTIQEIDCMLRCVDYSRMAATSKDDDSFVCLGVRTY